MDDGRLSYRVLIAVDIQGFSKRDTRQQLQARRLLYEVLDEAARSAGLNRDTWLNEDRGDGALMVLPADADPALATGDFVVGLAAAVRARNRGEPGTSPLRMRVAVHHGTITAGPFGPAGDAPVVVHRLLDARPLRALLQREPDRDIAVVVSDSLFRDVVQTGFSVLKANDFMSMKVVVKGEVFRGHLLTGTRAERKGRPPGPLIDFDEAVDVRPVEKRGS